MFIKLYLIAFPIFFIIDMVWLGIVAKGLYSKQLGFLMAPQVNWIAGIIFYTLFIGGLVLFVITPALKQESWTQALLFGALFGLISYATYDLTNLATIKNWPMIISLIDMAWGATIAASVSVITYFIAQRI